MIAIEKRSYDDCYRLFILEEKVDAIYELI